MKKILCNNDLSSNEKLLLLYLICNSTNNQIRITNEAIGEDLNLNTRTVHYSLRNLKLSNYIRIENYTCKRVIHILVDFE